jgi:HEPN domain-containing protein
LSLAGNYDNACFHVQQAIEKYLKGYLTFVELGFEKTRDIGHLHTKMPIVY